MIATMLPNKIKMLDVCINGYDSGQLVRQSQYEFRYRREDLSQAYAGLLMPPTTLTYRSNDLFPVMDQNLPEGELFIRLRSMFPKQEMTPMMLLALIGTNAIGRLGFSVPDSPPRQPIMGIDRAQLLATRYTPEVFNDLVTAYLSTGAGIAGMQPKIMVPDRASISIPTVIVKTGSPAYPGLAANEYLCLKTAQNAGILTPTFALSDDGQMLLVDRFDMDANGVRIGFEDIAALMGLRVRDTLSDRKYQGSYENIVQVLRALRLSDHDLERFYEQVAFSVMVSNGDGHLKNFGVLYENETSARLAPMFDVVTTSIYRYARYAGGLELEDRTMALKLFSGKNQTKTYPTTTELLKFGKDVCAVRRPETILRKIADAMDGLLATAMTDERIPKQLLAQLRPVWARGMEYAVEAAKSHTPSK